MDKEIIKGKRAIAYFDILGFREKVAKLTIDELADSYVQLIHNTDNYFFDETSSKIIRNDTCMRFIFSDSIFLVAREDTEQGFIELFSYAWRMMQIAFAMKFPLRGAIAYGDIYVDQSKGVFIGDSIVKAAVWESKQDWMGAVVDRSAIDRYHSVFEGEDLLNGIYNILLPVYPVPLKDGTVENQHVINWRTNIISEPGIKALFQNESNDKAVERKIENTLAFAKAIRENQLTYFNDSIVPIRYRRLYIGEHDPNQSVPLDNGDEY